MKTMTEITQLITDPKAFMGHFKETLLAVDSEFPEEEAKFLAAAAVLEQELGCSTTPTVKEFLAAKEAGFVAEAICIGWQGFQLNMDIFNNPANALMLQGDYEALHRERQLSSLPAVRQANEIIDAFYGYMRSHLSDKMELTKDIIGYYSYLETTGYKLVHYLGFRLADHVLPHMIPGYSSDSVNTMQYAGKLQEYLNVNLDSLG